MELWTTALLGWKRSNVLFSPCTSSLTQGMLNFGNDCMQNLPKYLAKRIITYSDDVFSNVTQSKATLIIKELRRPTRPLKADLLDEVKAFHCCVLNWRDHLGQSVIKA